MPEFYFFLGPVSTGCGPIPRVDHADLKLGALDPCPKLGDSFLISVH